MNHFKSLSMYQYIYVILLVVFMAFGFSTNVSAKVVLNELSTFDSNGDWVELYSSDLADISGWILRDSASSKIFTIPDSTQIAPESAYYVIDAGNRLNKDKDTVKLFKNDDVTLVDSVSYGSDSGLCAPVNSTQTVGRKPNGSGEFVILEGLTKGATNSIDQYTCPTPTPSLTPTSSPTPSPTSTPTSTPSPTLIPSPTPKKTSKPQIEEDESQLSETEILGLRDELKTPTPMPSQSPEPIAEKKSLPFFAGVFILGGMGFIGAAGYPFAKTRWLEYKKNKYNERHEQKNSLLKKIS